MDQFSPMDSAWVLRMVPSASTAGWCAMISRSEMAFSPFENLNDGPGLEVIAFDQSPQRKAFLVHGVEAFSFAVCSFQTRLDATTRRPLSSKYLGDWRRSVCAL